MLERNSLTLPFVFRSEAQSVATIARYVDVNATIVSITRNAIRTATPIFSRLRRAEIGTHHHISGRYIAAYASEMAWRSIIIVVITTFNKRLGLMRHISRHYAAL